MIRWRFVLTRLIVVIAAIALLRWGLGPVAGYITVRALESVTGAKVEIAKTRVGLFPPRLQLVDFAVADPRSDKEMRNAFQAETIDLVIDGPAFMQRRWVAREGRITGLQIGSRRETSGHYAEVEPEPPSVSDSPSMLSRMLGIATDKVNAQANAIAENLETVRRSKQIRARWEQEYENLVVRARDLEKQIRTIRDQARGIDNPLRDWPELERTLAQARRVRGDMLVVRQTIDALPDKLQADLASLEQAKQIDLAKVDRYVPGDLAASDKFGIDLLAEAARNQILRVRGYLDSGRAVANYTVVSPESERVRGINHDLDLLDRPEFMIRYCEVSGLLRSGGETYAMKGFVENVTPTPELLEQPTHARLDLEGPEFVRVEYYRDRRNGADIDELTVRWPHTNPQPLRLGNEVDAGIVIEGGERDLYVNIRTDGDRIEGSLTSKQTGLQMNLTVNPKYEGTAAVKSLASSLATVNQIVIDAKFNGTWKDIDLSLNTNLGQIFQRASQDAIAGQLRESRAQLAAKVNEVHAEQTRELREWLGSRQTEARSLLANADKSIEEMSQKVLDEVGDADAYLGKLRTAIRGKLR